MAVKDLVQIIRDNPGCLATIDNDCWWITSADGSRELVASSDKIKPLGDGGYGSGSFYGGDILQALAVIVGIEVQSV